MVTKTRPRWQLSVAVRAKRRAVRPYERFRGWVLFSTCRAISKIRPCTWSFECHNLLWNRRPGSRGFSFFYYPFQDVGAAMKIKAFLLSSFPIIAIKSPGNRTKSGLGLGFNCPSRTTPTTDAPVLFLISLFPIDL